MEEFDAIVVGGGIAGSTTSAALAMEGLRVLVCEAGLANERRLAGEFMHPPAARDLEKLGLLEPLLAGGAVPNYGFAMMGDRGRRLESLLSYSEVQGGRSTGVAMAHDELARGLLRAAAARPNVTLWDDCRVCSVDQTGLIPIARVRRKGETVDVRALLVISAEGRSSEIRKQAGIEMKKTRPFRMVGWKVPQGRLPYPGYGHVFTGGRTATLAYQVSRTDVRIMFELDEHDDLDVSERLEALPEPFRSDVERAIALQPRRMTQVFGMTVGRATSGRLAVVGDAGGCVHPITASGIAWCTQDALRLAREVGPRFHERKGEGIEAALASYERGRERAMRTRVTLGPVLADALAGQDPGARLIREGLFRYWRRSQRGRSASIGILSTERTTPTALAREFAAVSLNALPAIRRGVVRPAEIWPALRSLARRNTDVIRQARG